MLKDNNWNKDSYQEFINYLISLGDKKYLEFNQTIVNNSKYQMIGIRLPILRNIAKEIIKTDYQKFLECLDNYYYEEIMLEGLVISLIKKEEIFFKYFLKYIYKIDNWALCDTFVSSIKIVRKYQDRYYYKALSLAKDKEEFISRVGIVMILFHFINEFNLKEIYDLLNNIKNDKFYINMAMSWLICELYIKYPKETLIFIKDNDLNKFTHNKAISKICDSYRVSKQEKDYLKTLRR